MAQGPDVRGDWMAILLGAALLAGCAERPAPTLSDSGLVRSYVFTLDGRAYSVHRISDRENHYAVRTRNGEPGDRRAMREAVRLAYGCQSLALSETESDWRAAEARGALCTGGHQRYSDAR